MAEGDDERPHGAPKTELESISPDLPFELQSKLIDQLATMGVAGAGLVITLRGSLLQDASNLIWLAAIEFGLAALIALIAQVHLIEGLFARRLKSQRTRLMTLAAIVLMGMGVGSLGTSVVLEGGPASASSPIAEKPGTGQIQVAK